MIRRVAIIVNELGTNLIKHAAGGDLLLRELRAGSRTGVEVLSIDRGPGMDLNSLKLFKMAMTRMDWAAQRQKVLAQNISNADTPNYRPHDLKEVNFKEVLKGEMAPRVAVARTDAHHLKGTIPEQEPFRENSVRKTFEQSPDGRAPSAGSGWGHSGRATTRRLRMAEA